jgi:hypothetical protein
MISEIAPGAKLLILKTGNRYGFFSEEAVSSALQWVSNNREKFNITVINMSFVRGNYTFIPSWILSRRKQLSDLKKVGVASVAAAGNDFFRSNSVQGMSGTALLPETISAGGTHPYNYGISQYFSGAVAYTTDRDRIAHFTQRLHQSVGGQFFTDIFAACRESSAGIANDDATSVLEGTSVSTPIVSGAICLIQQYAMKKNGAYLSIDQLRTILRNSSMPVYDGDDEDDNVTNTQLTYNRLDVFGSLELIDGSPIDKREITVKNAKIRLNFKKESKDSLSFKLKVNTEEQPSSVVIGDTEVDFKSRKGVITARLKKANLDFTRFGLINADLSYNTIIPVTVIIGEDTYYARALIEYRSKQDKKGIGRSIR